MECRDPLTEQVIGAAIEVHRVLGPGLLESVYEKCMCHELTLRGVTHDAQHALPIIYKGTKLDFDFRVDILVPGLLIIELKTVERLMPIHEAQLLTYMKLARIHRGLLINFNVPLVKDGIKRMVL